MKIVVAEKISSVGQKLLGEQPGWEVVGPEAYAKAPDEHLKDADALIVRSAIRADKALIEKAPKLRVIGRAGVGVDNVDVDFATSRGIVVMNTPGANAVAVAEHTLGLMIALARHIPRADSTTQQGKWEKKSLQGTELRGKTLGIVGLGRVGIEVARRAVGFDMTVVAFDPYVSPAAAEELQVTLTSLEELYAKSDYISLHVGLTPQTDRMINRAALASMKRGVRIVNCARGELIDDAALGEALQSGQVAGAALDVFVKEPAKEHSLFGVANVIATPHIGGSTEEAQEAVGVQIAQQITEYLRASVVQNAVNVPSLSDSEFRQIRPYLQLAEKLASLLAQLTEGNLQEVRISYSGVLTRWKTALIRSYALIGLLQGRSQEVVNVVNAESVAAHRGIRISEVPSTAAAAADLNLVSIELRGAQSSVMARGTVVHGHSPRIMELNHIEVEAQLEGSLIVIRNRDVPGVIGKIGSTLGQNGVNIARFALGRDAAEARSAVATAEVAASTRSAIGIIQTDVPVQGEALDALRRIPELLSVRSVVL